jgi:hypothetical protein
VNQTLAAAQGSLDTAKLSADAQLFQNQKQAEALVAEKKARAQGVRKQNEALAGSGGTALVKLKIADALMGKDLVFLPGGKSGIGMQTLNVNQLLEAITARQAAQAAEEPKEQPAR